ncbi:TonB-dependent receptor [candidate division KSB1 bacterium]|nr:TonB-dependent receptor [candidate division KSB1 bacterium]
MKAQMGIYMLTGLLLLSATIDSYPGTSGTLAGYVLDEKNGAPLPGANVMIQNTKLGAATDAKGFFIIINVPPGIFTVEARMIGYSTVIQHNVKVLVDLRTTIRFNLSEEAIQGQEVVITAERPMLQKDVTATAHFVAPEELEFIPVTTIQEVVDLQPGVAAGHIRGGRKTEVMYLVDGIPIQEVIEGEIGSDLPNSAVVDLTVQTGGFNAEYGNAMSGVVNIITQEGQETFKSRAEISALNISTEPNPFGDRDPDFLDWIYEANVGGPILGNQISYFLSANAKMPDSRWKREQFGKRQLVFNDYESYNYNIVGKLSMRPWHNFKINLSGLLSMWKWREYDHKWKQNLLGLVPRDKRSYRFSLTMTHTLSKRVFYTIAISQYNVMKSIYGKSSRDQEPIKYEVDEDGNPNYLGYIIYGDYPWWMDHQEIHTIGKIDLVSQLTNHHQIKSGGEFVYYDLYKKNVYRRELIPYGAGFPRYYSYDTDYRYFPRRGALYLQDKIEYEGMVANIGYRYDFFDPMALRPAVEKRVLDQTDEWIIADKEKVTATVKHQFSPRIGLGLPVTNTSEFRINYGYFFQMPLFDYLYTNANLNIAQGFSPLGDPDLKPAKTVAYEVGYKHQFGKNYLLDVTIFNKDVTNLVDSNTYINQSRGEDMPISGITRYVNMAYVNVKGAEIFVKKRYGDLISGKASYTFMTAKGTGSSATEQFDWLIQGYKVTVDEYYLSWDQRHTLVLNLDIRQAGDWGVNLLWRWNSPLPYTEEKGYLTTPNNGRMTATTYFDLRIDKEFKFGPLHSFLYFEGLNLTDARNVLWVDAIGQAGGVLEDPGAWDSGRRFRFGAGLRL